MGFAEDKMWEYVKNNIIHIQALPLEDLLDHLSGCLTQPEIEGIRASLRNKGNSRTAFDFMNELRRRKDWVNQFISALRECRCSDIAELYQREYDGYQLPNRSQNSNIPPPSALVASPEPLLVYAQARGFQDPAYPREPASPAAATSPSGTTNPESQPQSQPPPLQQALSLTTTTGSPAPPVTLSQEDVNEKTETPMPEYQPAGGVLATNLTHSANVAAMGFQQDPDLTEAVSNPASRDTKKGDFESRLSQEETAPHPTEMPTMDGASSFTPFHRGRGKIAFAPNTDKVFRRKELATGNGAQDEPLTGRMGKFQPAPRVERAGGDRESFNRENELVDRSRGASALLGTRKVNEKTTQQLHPSPPAAPFNVRLAPGAAPKSQIPRKPQQNRDLLDTTTSPAIRETPARAVQPPTRIQNSRLPTNTGIHLRMDTSDREEEEEQAFSKPDVLTSVDPRNPATQRPASAAESRISSMNSSRLALDQSSGNFPRNESTLNQQKNEAHPRSRNKKNLDHRQGQGPSIEPSNSSAFSVSKDPIMISDSTRGSMPYENREPEEVDFPDGSPAKGSTEEVLSDYLNDNSAANRVSLSRNMPDEFDDANSMENTGRYEIRYSKNPTIDNYDPMNPINCTGNSQGKGGNENRNNNVPVYQMVLAAIAIVVFGVFLKYRSRET